MMGTVVYRTAFNTKALTEMQGRKLAAIGESVEGWNIICIQKWDVLAYPLTECQDACGAFHSTDASSRKSGQDDGSLSVKGSLIIFH